MKLQIKKVEQSHLEIIFSWLAQDFVTEFWHNTQAHKDDVINFAEGRKLPSNYADGQYVYWIASLDNEPFAMIMTIHEAHKDNICQEKILRLSRTGNTYGLDYMIGNLEFFGKGYDAITLIQFMDYFRACVDPKADTFLIDPAKDNPRAKHVYMKAGFEYACDFKMEGDVSGKDKIHHLLIKKFNPKTSLIPGKIEDYPVIQNMARFYVYDASRTCGHISSDWALPANGLYKSSDFRSYFEDPFRKAYLVKVYDEMAGFILLNQVTHDPKNTWNMGEFFIIAKFQGLGIASYVARKVWEMNPGLWEVSVIPENQAALCFWEKTISKYTAGVFEKSTRVINYDQHQPKRIIFTFDSQQNKKQGMDLKVTVRSTSIFDINQLVTLSKTKRLSYEKAQPQFWRYAGESGDCGQKKWFSELLNDQNTLMLTAQDEHQQILGFIIGRLLPAPEVYNPGGFTLMIDDFCVQSEKLWEVIGAQLIAAIKVKATVKGAAQLLIVCGKHDHVKRKFLMDQNLTIASEWFVGSIV